MLMRETFLAFGFLFSLVDLKFIDEAIQKFDSGKFHVGILRLKENKN